MAQSREERLARKRAWRAAHREEEKARARAWHAAHPEEEKARKRAYHAAHPEEEKARKRAWRAAHREEEKARARAYHAAHPERAGARVRDRRVRARAEVLAYYGARCAHCGETDDCCLTCDHVNDDGAAERRRLHQRGGGSWVLVSKAIRSGQAGRFRILCWNCNCGRRRCRRRGCSHPEAS